MRRLMLLMSMMANKDQQHRFRILVAFLQTCFKGSTYIDPPSRDIGAILRLRYIPYTDREPLSLKATMAEVAAPPKPGSGPLQGMNYVGSLGLFPQIGDAYCRCPKNKSLTIWGTYILELLILGNSIVRKPSSFPSRPVN